MRGDASAGDGRERGSVVLWMLGLGIALLMVGGIAVDLWRMLGIRRELAAMTDAAAVAAAEAVDAGMWRTSGTVVLDPGAATERALASLASQPLVEDVTLPPGWIVVVADEVVVTVETEVELTLLRLVHPDPVPVAVTARAAPVRRG